jgi:integrase
MVQQLQSSKLGSRTSRLKLPIQKKPYFVKLDRGLALGYRRTQTAGTWVMRVTKDGVDWTQTIAKADDHEDSNETDILTYGEAQTRAREFAKGDKPASTGTVADALDKYEADLRSRGGDVNNVARVRAHLPQKLARKLVSSAAKADFKSWMEELRGHMGPDSVNRTATAMRAALNLAADDAGGRITNREAWRAGLKPLESVRKSRNVILDEPDVRAIIGTAYRDSDEFGVLVELAAVTGARQSQLVRLVGENVQAKFVVVDPQTKAKKRQPRIMMPVSRKGKGKKPATHRPVPIPESLADRLANRTGPLFDVEAMPRIYDRFMFVIKDLKLNSKAKVTMYSLRHTSIVRQLLAGVPIRVVASLHDTSAAMIERNYSEFIADHADDLARPTLLQTIAEVVTLRKGVSEVPG